MRPIPLTIAALVMLVCMAFNSPDAEARHGRAGCGAEAACGEPAASCGRAARLERPAAACPNPNCPCGAGCPCGAECKCGTADCPDGQCPVPEAAAPADCPHCPQAEAWSDDGSGHYSQVQADGSVHHEHSVVHRGEGWHPGKWLGKAVRGVGKVARGTVRVAGRMAAAPVRAAGRVGHHARGCN